MEFKFTFRRHLFWKTLVVTGNRYAPELDRMFLYFKDGGIYEIPNWKSCHVKLGPDWALAQKKAMEDKTGQTVPVSPLKPVS